MKLPFNIEGIEEILRNDSGFQKVLSSLSSTDAASISSVLSDPAYFTDLLKYLPKQNQTQILETAKNFFQVPEKALQLYKQCRYFEARDYLKKAIALYTNYPELSSPGWDTSITFVAKRVQALCHNLLAVTEWELGNAEISKKHHLLAHKLSIEIGDSNTLAKSIYGLGVHFWEQGDIQNAEEHCLEALDYLDAENDPWDILSLILTTLSVIYGDIGEYDKALDYSNQAVDIAIETQDQKKISIALNNLAILYTEQGDLPQTQTILEYALEIIPDNHMLAQKALLLNNLALNLLQQNENAHTFNVATVYLEQALSIGKDICSPGTQARTLTNMGLLAKSQKDKDRARHFFEDALSIYKHLGSRTNQATVQTYLGELFKEDFQDLISASEVLQNAIETVESIRGSFHKELHRITYASREIDKYSLLIECLVDLGKPAQAFEYIERAKSRALLDFLSNQLSENLKGAENDHLYTKVIKSLQECEEIQTNLEKLTQKNATEGIENDTSQDSDDSLYRSLAMDLCEKEKLFADAYEEITKSNPNIATLLKVQTVTSEKMSNMLNEETWLLQLFQSEDKLYIFALGHTGQIETNSISLPIETAWKTIQEIIVALRDKKGLLLGSHEFIREIRTPLAKLYSLLIEPLRTPLIRCKRIIIAPHLFWHYLPFHCLYDKVNKEYFCDQYEIGYTPSASILDICRSNHHHSRDNALILCRNNGDLPHVDTEGDLLANVFSPKGKLLRDDEAHLGLLDEPEEAYDVVHIASHGMFISEQPLLSSVDIPVNLSEQRKTYLLDFFNKCLDVNLVTLSACDTGVINYTDADELIGMSRGLFAAGAASTMLSLWQVADKSTCYFMENFYWHFVKNNQPKTRAIQLAMQAVKAKPEYAHPFFWAPFRILGDWR